MESSNQSDGLRVVLFSFGYKYGIPLDVNMLLDVRFLPNPYWVDELRSKTGQQKDVANYVLQSEQGQVTSTKLKEFLKLLVENNSAAKKKTLRIAIGCTGGRHRSVAVTEEMAASLQNLAVELAMFHRDIEKDTIK